MKETRIAEGLDGFTRIIEYDDNDVTVRSEVKCARTDCAETENILYRHTQSGRVYCPLCARTINESSPGLVADPQRDR